MAGISLLVLSFVAFIALGLPDGLLGVAWPSMRLHFGQELSAMGILLAAGTGGYVISSFLSGWTRQKLGLGGLLAGSCGLTALALLAYTMVPLWLLILPFAIMLGLGAGSIDAGLNHYMESNHGHHLMQWLHASFGIGITLGPLIMTLGLSLGGSWTIGYLVVAGFQGLLGLLFLINRKKWDLDPGKSDKAESTQEETKPPIPLRATLGTPKAWLSALLFFVYCGIELGIGHWAYSILVEDRGFSPELGGLMVGAYWAMFTLGRVLGGFFTRVFKPLTLIRIGLGLAALGLILFWVNLGFLVNILAIGLIGLGIAPIFPSMVSSTSNRVGREHSANVMGMQMAFASLGVAILPGFAGLVASWGSLGDIPLVVLTLTVVLISLVTIASPKDQ